MEYTALTFGLVAVIYIICGFLLLQKPPKKINSVYGYRTGKSMQSQAAWDIAQPYAARIMIRQGLLFVMLGFIFYFIPDIPEKIAHIIEVSALVGIMIGSVVYMIFKTDQHVEKELAKQRSDS